MSMDKVTMGYQNPEDSFSQRGAKKELCKSIAQDRSRAQEMLHSGRLLLVLHASDLQADVIEAQATKGIPLLGTVGKELATSTSSIN